MKANKSHDPGPVPINLFDELQEPHIPESRKPLPIVQGKKDYKIITPVRGSDPGNLEWQKVLAKIAKATTRLEYETIKNEARYSKLFTYNQMDNILGRCEYQLYLLDNPKQPRDADRIERIQKLKGIIK